MHAILSFKIDLVSRYNYLVSRKDDLILRYYDLVTIYFNWKQFASVEYKVT